MYLVLISPEQDRPDEARVVESLFELGLDRYHVRKPQATRGDLSRWITSLPSRWRTRLVLHQHHDLVEELGVGGRHWKDRLAPDRGGVPASRGDLSGALFTSRSCHDLATLRFALGHFDSVFFGPVFPSVSKPGYGPKDAQVGEALGAILSTRSRYERRTQVIALGGITAVTAPRALVLGFDGVAVLGAVWQAGSPVDAFRGIQAAVSSVAHPRPVEVC